MEDGRKCFEKLTDEAKGAIVTFLDATEQLSADEVRAIEEYAFENLNKLRKEYL